MTQGVIRSAVVAVACGLALGACANMKPKTPHLEVPAPELVPPPKPTPVPVPPPVVVRVPVPVKEACVPKGFPRAPKYPDNDAALRDAGGAADRYQLMAAGRILRDRRLSELEKIVDGCR
jgi:hypothetical protein